MSMQLRLDEVLEAMTESNHPNTKFWVEQAEALLDNMAVSLAVHLGVEAGQSSFQGMAFAGLCVPMYPVDPDQPMPEALQGLDDGCDWEVRS